MRLLLLPAILCLALSSCSSVHHCTSEKVCANKGTIVPSTAKQACQSKPQPKQVSNSGLTEFSAVTGFKGGEPDKRYYTVNKAYLTAEKQTADLKQRRDAVKSFSQTLFRKWEQKIQWFDSPKLKPESARQLAAAKSHYNRLIFAIYGAEKSLDPALRNLHSHVLLLKRYRNSHTLEPLDVQVKTTRLEVIRKLRKMEQAVTDAEEFIKQFEKEAWVLKLKS